VTDWAADELAALERGVPVAVMGPIRARREAREREVRAAAKVSPESVRYRSATGLERCEYCEFYRPAPENRMYGDCAHVDLPQPAERNDVCDDWTVPAEGGAHPGGAAALSAAELTAMFTGGRDLAADGTAALITSNKALLGRVRMHRDQIAAKYGRYQPKLFARWGGWE